MKRLSFRANPLSVGGAELSLLIDISLFGETYGKRLWRD